jgi:phage terminase small subunit
MIDNVPFDELSRKQGTFIAALLTLPTIEAAALAAGVSGKTAHLWLKQENVQRAYRQARREAFSLAIDKLMSIVDESIETLRYIMNNAESSEMARVRSAQILLEKAIDAHKTEEIEVRIKELENTIHQISSNS